MAIKTRRDAGAMAPGAARSAGQRFEAEFGYGLAGRGNTGRLWHPYVGARSDEGAGGVLALGLRLSAGPELRAALEIGRRDNGREAPDTAVQLRGSFHWWSLRLARAALLWVQCTRARETSRSSTPP